ncbi:DUF6746 family protein [Marinimicrobium agarilyticum]|uniref:DUF6746 family protein n=1 Tax=Marinimicrobium agarilyticum TaxID=306546 RepID=UPI00041BF285|nr:DUF6746 family protein [Marinimicrobium agarilyticum]
MTFTRSLMILPLLATLSLSVQADDRLDHYKGKPADTLEQALANFAEGNRELRQLLEGEVSNADLARVHQLSYTLENALGKMNKEMRVLAMLLEQVHLASETAKAETVQGSGRAYFEIVDTLELGGDEQ